MVEPQVTYEYAQFLLLSIIHTSWMIMGSKYFHLSALVSFLQHSLSSIFVCLICLAYKTFWAMSVLQCLCTVPCKMVLQSCLELSAGTVMQNINQIQHGFRLTLFHYFITDKTGRKMPFQRRKELSSGGLGHLAINTQYGIFKLRLDLQCFIQ